METRLKNLKELLEHQGDQCGLDLNKSMFFLDMTNDYDFLAEIWVFLPTIPTFWRSIAFVFGLVWIVTVFSAVLHWLTAAPKENNSNDLPADRCTPRSEKPMQHLPWLKVPRDKRPKNRINLCETAQVCHTFLGRLVYFSLDSLSLTLVLTFFHLP